MSMEHDHRLRRRLRVPRLQRRLRADGRHKPPAGSEVKARSAGRNHKR